MPKVKDLMTPNPIMCQESDSVYHAVELMGQRHIGAIPILDSENSCCSIVTDRDICLKVVLEGLDPKTTLLKDVSSWNLFTCHPDDDTDDVLIQMIRKQIQRLPVVNDNEQCIGIISKHDITRTQNRYLQPDDVLDR